MTHTPRASQATDLLPALCEQIERTWNQHRDATLVDRLAAEHPTLAEALYEHLELVVRAELHLDQPDPTLAALDAHARQWLESGGYTHVAEVAREHALRSRTRDVEGTALEAGADSATTTPARHHSAHFDAGAAAGSPASAGSAPAGLASHAPSPADADGEAGQQRGQRRPTRRTFLGLLTETARATPQDVAEALGVNANFLVGVDGLGHTLPARAGDELARRAEARYGVARATGLGLLTGATGSGAMPMAASRGAGYGARLTYDALVRRSGLPPAEEAFWLALTDPASSHPG